MTIDRRLAILAGGEPDVIAGLADVFAVLGRATRLGPAGTGQLTKLANQIALIAAGQKIDNYWSYLRGAHLMDGFGDAPPYKDGLWWDIKRPTAEDSIQTPDDFAVDPSLSDDHEWGRQQLDGLLKKSNTTATAADENLVLDMEAVARSWQLSSPTWAKRAHGCFDLNTPYGMLVVRRLIGWTVERSDAPLVWAMGGERVIFDKLEHAKTSGLAHAPDYGDIRFVDGTWWDKRADN